ncbi:MAG: hypothetical protein IT158_06185, partial [Bryobacterales bacterium]|nr:hypothetical protein [Bryobacterales bacterium]
MRALRTLPLCAAALAALFAQSELERGFLQPPSDARPHVYWLWLNGYVDPQTAREELRAMKEAGFGGVLLFDMGARGDPRAQPPAGPAFLSPEWMRQFRESATQAKQLGLQVDFSVVSSWDLGGHWIRPEHASMGLYPVESVLEGGRAVDVQLPFPAVPAGAPRGADGKPAFRRDAAVAAVRDARRRQGHEFIFRLDPPGDHALREAVLDNGDPGGAETEGMSPVREFSVAVSAGGIREADFREVVRASLPRQAGPRRFSLPPGTHGRYARLRLLNPHDTGSPRWTLGEFALLDLQGRNVAAARATDPRRNGAEVVRSTVPFSSRAWNRENLHDGEVRGPGGIFATPGPPPLDVAGAGEVVDITRHVDAGGRLRWNAPAGTWTVQRYVVMNTGERLKVPSPNSDGWATDHFNPEATRAHMDYVIRRIRETLGDPARSGLRNLYLASYEVVGPVWSPGFMEEFRRRRGYEMTPYLPAVFGARVGGEETTERFLFDYRKTMSDVLIDAYYRAAREAAREAGLGIKSEAGGPGPPVHNVPVDALLANGAVDEIQGEFWPYRQQADSMWVVKETASAGHIYGKPRVHMESFSSFEGWREGPQDLKASADRVLCEGGNHFVWHTWTHAPPEAGRPGWVYLAGTHINRNVTWWGQARPFLDYLARASFLLQRGQFVGDVLYYYGDGGYRFVGPKRNEPSLGPGYDYDVANSDVILNRLSVRDGRFVLPGGPSYAVLALPEEAEAHPAVLEKIERLVREGGTVLGPKPLRAAGLEGYPQSDARVRAIAAKLWGGLDGKARTARRHGRGRVVWGRPLRGVLAEMGIGPDVTAPPGVDFIHRRDGAAEIYFVRNVEDKPSRPLVTFRVKDRMPELWDPRTGRMGPAPNYRRTEKGMAVELEFAPLGSIFVVFRRALEKPSAAGGEAREGPSIGIEGPWTVSFQAERGAPQRVEFPRLISWTA